MNKEERYKIDIDKKLKIIRYTHSGDILDEEIASAWANFLKMPEFTHQKYNLLSDYRGGKLLIPVDSISEIIDFMKQIEGIVRGKKQALIVDDPYSAAGSMLFESEVYAKVGFKVKVFSTEKAALQWLLF